MELLEKTRKINKLLQREENYRFDKIANRKDYYEH